MKIMKAREWKKIMENKIEVNFEKKITFLEAFVNRRV